MKTYLFEMLIMQTGKRTFPVLMAAALGLFATLCLQGQSAPELYPFRTGQLFGYVDNNLKTFIPPAYDDAEPFRGEFAVVKVFSHYGLIDKKGGKVVPNIYTELINEGRTWIIAKKGSIGDEKYGLLNNQGKELMPVEYDYIIPVGNTVLLTTKGYLCGLFDTLGREIIPVEYFKMDYQHGILSCKKNNLFGALSEKGKVLIPFEFDTLIISPDKYIAVSRKNKFGWFDSQGNEICKPIYDFLGYFSNGVSVFGKDGKYGLMDFKGQELLPPVYDGIWNFSNGCGLVLKDKKYGYAGMAGNIVVQPEYDAAWPFAGGRARVYKEGKYAYIDSSGSFITPFLFNACRDFTDSMARVDWENKSGFIGLNGQELFSVECDYLGNFNGSVALIRKNGRYGMIDRYFQEIIPLKYDTVILSFNRFIMAKNQEKRDIYDLSGKLLAGPEYSFSYPVNAYFIRVNKAEGKGLLNKAGKEIFPCTYKHISISQPQEGISAFHLNDKMGYLDTNGKIILNAEYGWCTEFKNGFGMVEISHKYGYVNKQGKLITPVKYISLDNFIDGLARVKESYSLTVWDYIDTSGRELYGTYKPSAQKKSPEYGAVRLQNTERYPLKSTFNGKNFVIQVVLPKDYYLTNKKYPVLYLTDADYLLGIAKNANDLLSFPKLIPELIIVGIAYESIFEDWWARRTSDLTPTPDSTAFLFPGGGDAEPFLKTLEKQIIPMIESKYRVYEAERAYAGYSLGGLFGTYAMFNRPTLFNRYLLISPSFWWNKELIFKMEEAFHSSGKVLQARMIFTAGSNETDMLKGIDKMMAVLKGHAYKDLIMESVKTANDNHYTTFPAAFTIGIQALYK